MTSLFASDSILPSEIITIIILLLSTDDLVDLKLVCKNLLLSLTDQNFREKQVRSWQNLFPSYVLGCYFIKCSCRPRVFSVIEIDNTKNTIQPFKSLLTNNSSTNSNHSRS